MRENRRRLMMSALRFPHLETRSGSVVSFPYGISAPLEAATLTITRQQSGSGNPTSSNVRPISIWNSVNVHVSPTNSGGTVTSIALPAGVVAGTVDLLAGTMSVTEIAFPISAIGYYTSTSAYVQGRVYPQAGYGISTVISSHLSTDNPSGTVGRMSWVYNTAYFNAPRDAVETLDDAGVQKWIQDNNVQFVAVLSSARTYSFTPATITTLDGQNYIWADAGDLALTYWTY